MSTNVVSLNKIRAIRKAKNRNPAYHARILSMNKVELLDEMMLFQQERSQLGHLSVEMMVRGQILFKALEKSAETKELHQLARSYRKHLQLELEAFLKTQPPVLDKVD